MVVFICQLPSCNSVHFSYSVPLQIELIVNLKSRELFVIHELDTVSFVCLISSDSFVIYPFLHDIMLWGLVFFFEATIKVFSEILFAQYYIYIFKLYKNITFLLNFKYRHDKLKYC